MYTMYLLIMQLNYFKRYYLKYTLNTDLNANGSIIVYLLKSHILLCLRTGVPMCGPFVF